MKKWMIFCLAGLLIAGGLMLGFHAQPDLAKAYSAAVIAPITGWMAGLMAGTSAVVAEYLIAGLLITLCAAGLAAAIASCIRRKLIHLKRYLAGILCVAVGVSVLYSSLWAPLYAVPAAASSNLPFGEAQLVELSTHLIDNANNLRELIPDGPRGLAAVDTSTESIAVNARALTSAVTGRELAAPKPTYNTKVYDALGIAGLYFPFTFESIVNMNDLPTAIPFTACHELAHQAGYAREDEASFIAYLACCRGDAGFAYSGTLNVLTESMKQLRNISVISAFELEERMSEGVKRDIAALSGGYDIPATARMGGTVTDVFLRFNGQLSGLDSYSNVAYYVYLYLFSPDSVTQA